MKALFYITGEKVQHIGCRLVVTRELIYRDFKKGGAFNLPDGRVEVVLGDKDKDKIVETHRYLKENLVSLLKRDSGDREKLGKLIGNPGIKVTNLEFNEDILVLDIGLFSHALTFDQVYKGVDVYDKVARAIEKLNKTLGKER